MMFCYVQAVAISVLMMFCYVQAVAVSVLMMFCYVQAVAVSSESTISQTVSEVDQVADVLLACHCHGVSKHLHVDFGTSPAASLAGQLSRQATIFVYIVSKTEAMEIHRRHAGNIYQLFQ
jgi:hypothetical protein